MRSGELQKIMKKGMRRGIRLVLKKSKVRKTDPSSQEQMSTQQTYAYNCPKCSATVTDICGSDAPVIKVRKQCPSCKTVFFITRQKKLWSKKI